MTARDSYLGWDTLDHFEGCARPAWTVDVKTEYDAYRYRDRESTAPHSCPDEACGHGPRYERTTLRVVCLSCTRLHVIASETGLRVTPAQHTGYGLPPERKHGLLLWPGEPLLTYGRLAAEEPFDYLVTHPRGTRPTKETVVGEITQARGQRGAVLYAAVARLDPAGEYGYGEYRWANAVMGLRSVGAAAKWIAAAVGGETR
jgi:hypothetical protein